MKIKWVCLLLLSQPAWSLDSDRQAKIIIESPSSSCKLQLKENKTECTNGLTIQQGSLLIKSTYGLINHQDKSIRNVLMRGDQVYMEQMMEDGKKMVIKANEMDYQKAVDKVFLKGAVSITSAIGVTTGENLELDLQTQEIISRGDTDQQFRMEIDQKDD